MTTPPDASVTSPIVRSRTPRRLMILLLAFIAITLALWYTGALKPRARVALVTANEGPYWDLIIRGAQDSADRYNLRLTVVKSKGDDQTQTDAIKKLLEARIDGIAVSPNNPPMQAAILADVAAQTKLVTYDSDSPVAGKICFIGTNNYEAGRLCGEYIHQAIPDGGEVLLCIGSLDKENGQRRRQGVIDELLERPFEPTRPMDAIDAPLQGRKYTIVATIVDGIDPDKATALAVEALKKHPNIKAAAGLFAYNTPSLLKALDEAKLSGKVQLVGFDTNDPTLDGVEAGTVFASIMQDPYNIGREAVRVLGDAAAGDKLALPMYQQFFLACEPVTKSNCAAIRQDLAKKRRSSTQPST